MGRYKRSPSTPPSSISSLSSSSTISSLCYRLNSALKAPRSRTTTSSVRTTKLTLHSSAHGRLRRQQRGLSKYELRKAMKHGKKGVLDAGRKIIYRLDDLVVIVDSQTKREITSYKVSVDLPYKEVTVDCTERHKRALRRNHSHPHQCKSHAILLVDKSGSMKTPDVQGCRSRFGAVFLSIAEDFIRNRIDSGFAGPEDAISIILMGERPEVLINGWPSDNITYNFCLRIMKEGIVRAGGHCCYKPSIELAQQMFEKYDSASCQLVLGLFTDGRPSDASIFKMNWGDSIDTILESTNKLASKAGTRLCIRAIGMGSANQWQSLEKICDGAKNYGCQASVQTPSMSASGLGAVVSSIATSLSESQLLQERGGGVKRVLPVRREDRSLIPLLTEVVNEKEFDIFMHGQVSREVHITGDAFQQVSFQHPDARGVAIRKEPFAEGSERFAHQFFEVAEDGRTVVGEPLVAKISKFVREENEKVSLEEFTHKFVARFCRIQKIASRLAQSYNEKLDSITRLDSSVPRVNFVDCSVYRTHRTSGTNYAYVVEPRLFGKFEKWNSNNGWIRGFKPSPVKSFGLVPIKEEPMDDVAIKKENEDVNRGGEGDMVVDDNIVDLTGEEEEDTLFIPADELAQAFSHYSLILERRKILVCDLQGVYDRQKRLLRLTDPVIHYFNRETESSGKYGRTDRGGKGISDFLGTHECNCLCNLVTKGFLPVKN